MLVTNTTTIGFALPSESALAERFKYEHNMNDWSVNETTNYIFFTAVKHSTVTDKSQGDAYENHKDQ